MAGGKAVGSQYVQSVQDYLDRTVELPVAADGTLNITEMAEITGVPRQSFELCSKVVYRQITTDLNKVAYCCYKGFPTK